MAVSPTSLPPLLHPLFWEYRIEDVHWETNQDFIIRRILAAGSWEQVTWLRLQLGDAGLKRWLEQQQGKGLRPHQLRFWQLVLDISTPQVNAWLAKQPSSPWNNRIARGENQEMPISAQQEQVLHQLAPLMSQLPMYLAGGTALAMLLEHRQSVDFDWFSDEPLTDPLQLAQQLRDSGLAFITGQVSPGTLHGTIEGVHVSFLEYRYPLLEPLMSWENPTFLMAAPADLACMKLSAIAQRGARKDFIDLYALGQNHFSLQTMLHMYQQKYGVKDIGHVLYSLAYFDDALQEPMPVMHWQTNWQTIQQTIETWVQAVGRG